MIIRDRIVEKLSRLVAARWPAAAKVPFSVEPPPGGRHGDVATSLALKLAPVLKRPPMEVAQEIAAAFAADRPALPAVGRVEAATPGFVNFTLDDRWLFRQVPVVARLRHRFGRSDFGKGKRVVVEFISANPTGPLTLANGRGGFFGDVLANVLALAGFRPHREYYVNDQGNQVNILAESVLRRYWQAKGIPVDYPEYCYQGEYIRDLARTLYLPNYKLGASGQLDAVRDKIKDRIVAKLFTGIRRVIEHRMGIRFDRYFSERSLFDDGFVKRTVQLLTDKGLIETKDGALWMKTTGFGDDKDRVLKKSDGEPTYFLSDIALRFERFTRRKFNREVLILGADHHGYVRRLEAAMAALGFPGRLDVRLVQFVRLFQDGVEVRMSKRRGTYVTMDDLLDEVNLDAVRFFFLQNAADSHMDFNLDLAREQSAKNPVYYVQYAYARISSILKTLKRQRAIVQRTRTARHPAERALLVELLRWPEIVADTARDYAIHRLPAYSLDLARAFHDFYDRVRVIDGDVVSAERLALLTATQIVLANVLQTMGVRAPEKM